MSNHYDYDTQLFIEIIESSQGVLFLGCEYVNGVHTRFYQGAHGKTVIIETTDETILIPTCKSYLMQLGLKDLIIAIFPDSKVDEGYSPLKIGDVVFHMDTGRKYEIVGDCTTPFKHQDNSEIFPDKDYDFVLIDTFNVNDHIHAKKDILVRA